MVMKRLVFALAAVFAIGCNKPDEDACKKAIENMRKLMGTQGYATDLAPAIRRCRSASSKEAVACASGAKSRADLEKCGFAHFDETPAKAPEGSGSGSAK
jgi:hypothetical protein